MAAATDLPTQTSDLRPGRYEPRTGEGRGMRVGDARGVTVGENGGASTGGETVAAPVARVVTRDLHGRAWHVNHTKRVISIDASCPPADRPFFIWQAMCALLAPGPRPPRLRVVR